MKFFILMCLIVSFGTAKPLQVDEKTSFYDILPHSQIFIDKTKTLDLKGIQKKSLVQTVKNF